MAKLENTRHFKFTQEIVKILHEFDSTKTVELHCESYGRKVYIYTLTFHSHIDRNSAYETKIFELKNLFDNRFMKHRCILGFFAQNK